MLAPANYYFLYQELSVFVYRSVKKLHSAPLKAGNRIRAGINSSEHREHKGEEGEEQTTPTLQI